mgnify:CR=1 FL=1
MLIDSFYKLSFLTIGWFNYLYGVESIFKMSVKHSIRIFFFIIALVYTGSLTAQEKAYPKNGEGITLFLKRFNRTGGTYQKEFIELNKGKLGKNNSLRMGVKYTLPPLASAPQKKNYQPYSASR